MKVRIEPLDNILKTGANQNLMEAEIALVRGDHDEAAEEATMAILSEVQALQLRHGDQKALQLIKEAGNPKLKTD